MFAGVTAAGPAPFMQLIWWAIFMGAFAPGYKVERARKRATPCSTACRTRAADF